MAKNYIWKINIFNGGESEDEKIGPAGSFRYSVGNDIHADLGKLQVAAKPVKQSDTTIDDVVTWIEPHPTNGDIYLYVQDKITKLSGSTWSDVRSIGAGSPAGQGLCDFNGYLYYRTGTTLGRYDYASTWDDSYKTSLQSMTTPAKMLRFKNYLLVPNGRYVATLDDVGTWLPQRLSLPPGYNVRSMSRIGSYAAIVAMRGNTITDSDEGMLFLWNGTSQNFDDFIPIDGNPHAVVVKDNVITIISGMQPSILQSTGGVASVKHRIPSVGIGKTAEVYPGAIDVWNNRIYFGISAGTSTSVLRVVREWGAKKAAYPDVSNPIFPISTGTLTGTGVQITAVKKVGTTLWFAWKDGSGYGVDKVDTTQKQASSVYRSLVHDHNTPYIKSGLHALVELVGALKENESVTLKVGVNPYDDPTFADTATYTSITTTTAGVKELRIPLSNATAPIKGRDLALEVTLGGSASTKPAIKGIWILNTEQDDTL